MVIMRSSHIHCSGEVPASQSVPGIRAHPGHPLEFLEQSDPLAGLGEKRGAATQVSKDYFAWGKALTP